MLMLVTMLIAAAPIQIEPGKSFAKVSIGMSRAEVAKLHTLKSDGIDRAERAGFVSGALYFIFNAQDVLVLVGVELQKSGGVRIGKVQIPARISAEDFVKRVPNCTLSDGSGGHAISCGDSLNAYDSWGGKYVEVVQLGPG